MKLQHLSAGIAALSLALISIGCDGGGERSTDGERRSDEPNSPNRQDPSQPSRPSEPGQPPAQPSTPNP